MVAGQAGRSAKPLRARRRGAHTTLFTQLDVCVNVLPVVIQIFLTGRILKWLGVGLVYRAGNQIGAWSYPLLTWLGLGLTGISFVAAWCALSLWLGRRQIALATQREPHVR